MGNPWTPQFDSSSSSSSSTGPSSPATAHNHSSSAFERHLATVGTSSFGFKPSDLELINNFLLKKVLGEQLPSDAVIEGEVYGDNAQLPEGNGSGEELYLFVKTKKKQKGTKTIRFARNGYWKFTGNKKNIFDKSRKHICTKRSLVFKRKSNSRRKKNLVMDEYSLTRSMIQNNSEEWVLCRIKQSNRSSEMSTPKKKKKKKKKAMIQQALIWMLTASR